MGSLNQPFGNNLIQLNVSGLEYDDPRKAYHYHIDCQGMLAPSWTLKSQFSYDVFNRAPIFYLSYNRPNLGIGWFSNVALTYVSERYNYPLAYLAWGNNNWSASGGIGYRWLFDRSLFPSVTLSANALWISQLHPNQAVTKSPMMSVNVEVLPQTSIGYGFQYDERQSAANRYHSVSITTRFQEFSNFYGTYTWGDFFHQSLCYRNLGFTVNPLKNLGIQADYTNRELDAAVDEFYTITATIRFLSNILVRAYYQKLSLSSVGASNDNFNLLLQYYITNRSSIYFLTNLRDNLRRTDLVGRISYEVDF
jgi:hypothetical protein